MLPPVLHIFRTVATAVVPEAAALRPDEWSVVSSEGPMTDEKSGLSYTFVTYDRKQVS